MNRSDLQLIVNIGTEFVGLAMMGIGTAIDNPATAVFGAALYVGAIIRTRGKVE